MRSRRLTDGQACRLRAATAAITRVVAAVVLSVGKTFWIREEQGFGGFLQVDVPLHLGELGAATRVSTGCRLDPGTGGCADRGGSPFAAARAVVNGDPISSGRTKRTIQTLCSKLLLMSRRASTS